MRLLLQKTATVHMVIIAFVPPFVNMHFEKCLIFYSSLTKINEKTVRFECNRTVFIFLFPRY